MSQVHLHIPSFNAGELSPLLGARFAVEKVQAGCRRLRNFIPHVHGPAFRRPGMEWMGLSAGNGEKSSLRGFNFSTTTGFVLEFHSGGLKVWSNGLPVPLLNAVELPYTEEECAEVQIAQVNDVCYLVHPAHRPQKLVRHADDDWRLEEIPWKWPALGDENVRTAEIATPAVTERLSVPTYEWPEFTMHGADGYTFAIEGAPTTGIQKVVKLWKWHPHANPQLSEWVLAKTQSWTTILPGDKVDVVGDAFGVPSTWRLTWNEPYAEPLAGSLARMTWTGGGVHVLNLDSQYRASLASVVVPVGDWQATVVCGPDITPGSVLTVQKLVGASWLLNMEIELEEGSTVIQRGVPLTAATTMRFLWRNKFTSGSQESGKGMYVSAGVPGTAKLQSIVFPETDDITLASSSVNADGATLTASEPIFQTGHIGSIWQLAHRRELGSVDIRGGGAADTPPSNGHILDAVASATLRVAGAWEVFTYGIWGTTLFLEQEVNGVFETVREWKGNKDRNVIANGTVEGEVNMRLRVIAGTAAYDTDQGVSKPRFVLETTDSRVNGLVKITDVGTLNADGKATTATIDILVTLHTTAATPYWTEGAWSDVNGFPRAVALHGGRLWFGGTSKEPLRLWGSVVNDYENFRRTTLDDGSVSFTPAAQQSNALQWLCSHANNLILGTNGDEWTVSGGTPDGPITPTSVNIQRRSGYGSQYLPAVLFGDVVIFVQRGGRKLRSVAPKQDGLVWSASDLTVLAEHVARAGIVQVAAMNFPQSILWAVTADGKLLGMTFEQEQNVFAWHVHETEGEIESVAVVYGVHSDEVWLQVKREGVRSIERLDPNVMSIRFTDASRLIYLDAAKMLELSPSSATLTGLEHLEGREVSVLGDGAELPTVRVIDGTVTLESPVAVAIVGLPFTSELQPMRMEIPLRDGTAQHRQWKVSRIALDVYQSLGGTVAHSLTGKAEALNYRRTADAMDSPPPLYDGAIETAVEARTGDGVDAVVRTSGPLPLNLVSMTLKLDVYGE